MAGDLEVDVAVPLSERATVAELVGKIVSLLKWPRLNSAGQLVPYAALDPVTRSEISPHLLASTTELIHGGTVVLAPRANNS
jgi:hypothetical protein